MPDWVAMALDRLLDIIRKSKSKYPALTQRLTEAEALGRWEKAVGPMIAKHARALRVREAVLWVEVDHPIWKSELHYRKRQILDILNDQLATATESEKKLPRLKDIFFVDRYGSA